MIRDDTMIRKWGFNSRTREGCDLRTQEQPKRGKFQFTHPRGVRFVSYTHGDNQDCFNSRTREGCDFSGLTNTLAFNVSIHAPARGAI